MKQELHVKEIEDYITKLRNRGKLPHEVIQLVEVDLKDGLTIEQTAQYTDKKWDIRQMRVYSDCLKQGFEVEQIGLICNPEYSASKMELLYDFVVKGLPMDGVKFLAEVTDGSAKLKYGLEAYEKEYGNFKEVLEKENFETVEEKSKEMMEYEHILLEELQRISNSILFYNQQYATLQEQIKRLEHGKDYEAEKVVLLQKIQDKEEEVYTKQAELSDAHITLARLRTEKEAWEKEKKEFLSEKEEQERRVRNLKLDIEDLNQRRMVHTRNVEENVREIIETENTTRKPSIAHAFIAKLGFRKKSRADIVKLVASGSLVAAQLVEIKHGIQQGLTESQLLELIHNNVPAENMKEIIEIAVLENQWKD